MNPLLSYTLIFLRLAGLATLCCFIYAVASGRGVGRFTYWTLYVTAGSFALAVILWVGHYLWITSYSQKKKLKNDS